MHNLHDIAFSIKETLWLPTAHRRVIHFTLPENLFGLSTHDIYVDRNYPMDQLRLEIAGWKFTMKMETD